MFLFKNQLDLPPSFENRLFEIGVWTDNQQNQSYFYCSSIRIPKINHVLLSPTDSAIFRISVESTEKWEFIGRVDFLFKSATTSPDGNYFWSIEPVHHGRHASTLIFREIEIRTLKYEVFKVDGNCFGCILI